MRIIAPLERPWKHVEQFVSKGLDRLRDHTAPSAGETTPEPEKKPPPPKRKKSRLSNGRSISLALQGGGAHGAFTWGVLDRLLEEGCFRIEGITGASAGAMNAVVAANGILQSGPEQAREDLEKFWRQVSTKSLFATYHGSLLERFLNGWSMDGSGRHLGMDMATRVLSPYQFNPFDLNPLRDLLQESVDFERLQRNRRIKLFIAATHIGTGRARIFRTAELTADAVLASATLPALHHAVEIDGEHYWDGGFSANPPLIPLIERGVSDDILLVQIEPTHEEDRPVTATEIRNRVAQLTFLGPLNRELEMIGWMAKLARRTVASPLAKRFLSIRLHRIEAGDDLRELGHASRLSPEWGVLAHARDAGRNRAEEWLAAHGDRVGKNGTFDYAGQPRKTAA